MKRGIGYAGRTGKEEGRVSTWQFLETLSSSWRIGGWKRRRKKGLHWEPITANCMRGPVGPCKMLVAMKNKEAPMALALEIPINNL